jgi:hypothetical protein
MIPAIPTKYNGVEYKSKLEAKYAYVLTRFGYKIRYEPIKHINGKLTHICDFYLYDIGAFAEVKPFSLNQLEYLKAYSFVRQYKKPYILLIGAPTPQFYQTVILPEMLIEHDEVKPLSEDAILNYFSVDLIECLEAKEVIYRKKATLNQLAMTKPDLWFNAIYEAEMQFR